MATPERANPSQGKQQPAIYQIRIAGQLSPRWQARFDDMAISRGGNGDTFLTGPVVDQAALHGLLRTVRDLGLPLISINEVDRQRSSDPDTPGIRDRHDGTEGGA